MICLKSWCRHAEADHTVEGGFDWCRRCARGLTIQRAHCAHFFERHSANFQSCSQPFSDPGRKDSPSEAPKAAGAPLYGIVQVVGASLDAQEALEALLTLIEDAFQQGAISYQDPEEVGKRAPPGAGNRLVEKAIELRRVYP